MHKHQDRPASSRQWLRRHDILNFITTLYEGDLHAKRVLSLANATLGVLTSASLAIHAVERGLAQAMGTLTKHGVKQVDRLLSNRGVDVWAFFAYWTPFIVAARTEVVVALDWTSFAADGQDTIVLSMVTGHGRATPLLWKTVASSTLKGLQHIWCDEALRARLFVLLNEHILPEADRTVGRPGMDLWQILVLGVLKQGLGCDFDRLHDLTNHHQTIRAFLGHGDFDDKTRYEYQTVVDNVSLLTPELLSAVGRLVVESGHKVAKKKPGEPLRGRCDSFVVETDVHYPTDVSLLWDAVRCLLRETGLTAEQYAVRGWRQWRHLSREVKKLFNRVRSTRRAQRHPERVAAYVERCRALVERAEATLDVLRGQGVGELGCRSISGLVAHARRQIDQVERRLLRGETIPHEEKVFSIFEEHTRWVSKGKAGTPVELGVPVAIIEDQYGFILHHKVLWEGEDVDVAVSMVQEAQALYPELRACSFDRGFHSRDNRVRLDALLDVNALPGRGYLSRADREREEEESFVAARRAHPAIESAINGLEHRGLDRVRSHGADGFARTVALSVLAANLHRIGLILQKRKRKRQRLVA